MARDRLYPKATPSFILVSMNGVNNHNQRLVTITKHDGIEWGDAVHDAKLIEKATLIPEMTAVLEEALSVILSHLPLNAGGNGKCGSGLHHCRCTICKLRSIIAEVRS